MATTGTTNFNPGLGTLALHAFDIAGVRATALTQAHMQSAYMATNLLCSRWSNLPNLWSISLNTITLVAGQAAYPIPGNVVLMLDAYAENTGGTQPIDRLILPTSRSEYASYTSKTQQGAITTYWFNRQLPNNATATFYLVPDGTTDTTVKYYALTQLQDAALTGNQNVDVPYVFLEAFVDALAYRLARIWTPERAAMLKADANESFQIAADTNIEQAAFYIQPGMSQYWRP